MQGMLRPFRNELFDRLKIKKAMTKQRARIRSGKRMVAWSNGERTNIIPSLRSEVSDYGKMLIEYNWLIDEGYLIDFGPCNFVREECRCREHEADHYWEQGHHLEALKEMMRAAMWVLPDESAGFEFEDVQWLNPMETFCWHPNVREFLRYNRRCKDYCKRDPRLWPVYNGSSIERDYHGYLRALGQWVHDA